jgi:hypothetical protein
MIPTLIASAALLSKELPYSPTELIYQSADAIQDARKKLLSTADKDLNRFVELSAQGKYSDAYQIWSDLMVRYFSFGLELGRTGQLSLNEKVKATAIEEDMLVKKEFQQKLSSHSGLLSTFLHNAEAAGHLTPQQRLFTQQILQEYQETHVNEAKKIAEVLQKISGTASKFSPLTSAVSPGTSPTCMAASVLGNSGSISLLKSSATLMPRSYVCRKFGIQRRCAPSLKN